MAELRTQAFSARLKSAQVLSVERHLARSNGKTAWKPRNKIPLQFRCSAVYFP
jgi:hypothetical protein